MILSGNLDGTPEVVGQQVVYPPYGQFKTSAGVLSPSLIPGYMPVTNAAWSTTYQQVLNRTYYFPMQIAKGQERLLQEIWVEVTTLQASGYLKLALYRADTDWQPTSLVADFGSIDASSTGVKKIVGLNLMVDGPQRYLWATNSGGSATAATYRAWRAFVPTALPIDSVNPGNTIAQIHVNSQTLSAGWPSTGIKWTNLSNFAGTSDALFTVFLTVWSER